MTDSHILQAAGWAAGKLAGKTRKHNGTPAIWHSQRVAARVACLPGISIQGVIAGFCHDVPEDCGASDKERTALLEEIGELWGPIVRQMVADLTNVSSFVQAPREHRKALDRSHLKNALPESKRIKIVDRIDNLHETLMDMQRGLNKDFAANALYVTESRQLLEESLRGVDPAMEAELMSTIDYVGRWVLPKLPKL